MPRADAYSDPTNGEEFEPYWDPLSRRDDRMYKKFIRMLHKAGYLVYTQRPKGHCGVFFVHKSDGQKIRMIIDARGTNMMFDAPPGVDLLTSDGFSRIEIHVPENLQPGTAEFNRYLETRKVSIGLSDVKDCFHRLRQPRWLAEYFCLRPVPARWVGLQGSILDGVSLGPEDYVYSASGSLCMGFSWSLFFAQRVGERLMSTASALQSSILVNDRSEALVLGDERESSGLKESRVHHYVYVDNLGLMSVDQSSVEEGLKDVERASI